jgi:hypothetical protein
VVLNAEKALRTNKAGLRELPAFKIGMTVRCESNLMLQLKLEGFGRHLLCQMIQQLRKAIS